MGTAILHGDGADLSATGRFGLADRQVDARLTFSGPAPIGSAAGRPEVYVAVRGPIGATQRTVDATALSAWLTLRAVDREAKRIDAIEAAARDSATNPSEAKPTPGGTAASAPPSPATPRPLPPARRRPASPPIRPEASAAPGPAAAPTLPPPINIRPAPSAAGNQTRPRTPGSAGNPPRSAPARPPADAAPAEERSLLDRLFGSQR
jgi:large subunit ribosomal protein L24